MHKQKKWNIYMMSNDHKIYLHKALTTLEAINWLKENCRIKNTDYFMNGNQVFCECR